MEQVGLVVRTNEVATLSLCGDHAFRIIVLLMLDGSLPLENPPKTTKLIYYHLWNNLMGFNMFVFSYGMCDSFIIKIVHIWNAITF